MIRDLKNVDLKNVSRRFNVEKKRTHSAENT